MSDSPSSEKPGSGTHQPDADSFAEAVGDVRPIKQTVRVDAGASKLADPGLERRRAAATEETRGDGNFLSTEHAPPVGPHDVISFLRPGVQHGVYKKLRLGQYEIEATLDLHRRTVAEARKELWAFIQQCSAYGLRTVVVTHGKGERNPGQKGILKSFVAKWLPEMEQVLAVHSAQARHGGTGAVYVLLKKGEKAKLHNREQHKKYKNSPG